LSALILASPLVSGGDNFYTALWIRPLIIGAGLVFLLSRFKQARFQLAIPAGNRLLAALATLLSLSLVLTHYYYITIYWYSYLLVYLLLFYLLLNLLLEQERGRMKAALFGIFLASGLIQAGLGLFEFFAAPGFGSAGTFFNPSYYAGYLAGLIGFPFVALVFDFRPGLSRAKRIALKAGMGFSVLLIFSGILVSASRSALFVVVPVGMILAARFRLKSILILAVLALALALIPSPLRERFSNLSRDPYSWERLSIWKSSLKMIAHHPQGVGLGMYGYYYHRYSSPLTKVKIGRFGMQVDQAHNELLNFAAESSPLAPLLALSFLGLISARFLRALRSGNLPQQELAWLWSFSGSALAILAHSLVNYNLHQPPIMILAVTDTAAIIALLSKSSPKMVRRVDYLVNRPRIMRVVVLAVGVLFAGLVTWQTAIEALFYQALKAKELDKRIIKLYRLSVLPSGYAGVYSRLGEDFRQQFIFREEPEFAEQAIKYLGLASRLNPEDAEYYYIRAECLYRLALSAKNPQSLDESEDLCQQALKRAPGQVFNHLLLANISFLREDYKSAERYLLTALEYEPYFLRARSQLVSVALEKGDLNRARQEYKRLLDQKNEVDALLKSNPNSLNSYQRLLAATDDKELARLKLELAPKPK